MSASATQGGHNNIMSYKNKILCSTPLRALHILHSGHVTKLLLLATA